MALPNDMEFAFPTEVPGAGVKLVRFDEGIGHVTVRHVEMQHAGATGDSGHDVVYSIGAGFLTFSYCYLHDVSRYPMVLDHTSDCLVEHSYFARNESTSAEHGEGIFTVFSHRMVVRHNTFEDIEGTVCILVSGGDDWQIYGNLFFWTPGFSRSTFGNGVIGTWSQVEYYSRNVRVYNNTFANITGALNGGLGLKDGGNVAYNNLWYNVDRPRLYGVTHDYNAAFASAETSSFTTEAHMQVTSGDPFRNSGSRDFTLRAPTTQGMTLPSPYNTDVLGRTRGGDGVWDRGAFEF